MAIVLNLASMKDKRLSLKELLELSLMAAVMFGAKTVLSFIPNVHIGAVLLIVATLRFGYKSLYLSFVYVMLEGLCYGFGLWWISYIYIWPILVLAVLPLRKRKSLLSLSIAGAIHGYLFGALCAIPVAFISGFPAAFSYWIAGIPFDLIHGTSNFVLCLVLIRPLDALFEKL